jgi:hypothetical protein
MLLHKIKNNTYEHDHRRDNVVGDAYRSTTPCMSMITEVVPLRKVDEVDKMTPVHKGVFANPNGIIPINLSKPWESKGK